MHRSGDGILPSAHASACRRACSAGLLAGNMTARTLPFALTAAALPSFLPRGGFPTGSGGFCATATH